MIEKNIFRPLPSLKKSEIDKTDGVEQGEEEYDPAWPYLQMVYQLFLQIAMADIDPQIMKRFITPIFVQKFLDLFDTPNVEEREYLKNILHKLYARIVPRRKLIRR